MFLAEWEQGLDADDFDLVDSDPNSFWTILLQTWGATRKRDGLTYTQEVMQSTSHFATATQLTVTLVIKGFISEDYVCRKYSLNIRRN